LESIVTLVHLLVGLLVVWFTFHAVADRIREQKIKKLIHARDGEGARDRVAEDPRRNER